MSVNTPIKTYSIKKINKNSITVEISGTDLSTVNRLRKTIISDVKTIAIDTVEIEENSTLILDEVLSHRLGLIPIEILDESILNCTCDCSGENIECPTCQITFTLNMTCTNGSGHLTTEHLKTSDKRIKIYNDISNMMIVPIRSGQTLRLTAKTQKGSGRIHAKWSPVSVISFNEVGDINEGESSENIEESNILKPTKYIFTFETTGVLSPEKVFMAGIALVPELSTNFILN